MTKNKFLSLFKKERQLISREKVSISKEEKTRGTISSKEIEKLRLENRKLKENLDFLNRLGDNGASDDELNQEANRAIEKLSELREAKREEEDLKNRIEEIKEKERKRMAINPTDYEQYRDLLRLIAEKEELEKELRKKREEIEKLGKEVERLKKEILDKYSDLEKQKVSLEGNLNKRKYELIGNKELENSLSVSVSKLTNIAGRALLVSSSEIQKAIFIWNYYKDSEKLVKDLLEFQGAISKDNNNYFENKKKEIIESVLKELTIKLEELCQLKDELIKLEMRLKNVDKIVRQISNYYSGTFHAPVFGGNITAGDNANFGSIETQHNYEARVQQNSPPNLGNN